MIETLKQAGIRWYEWSKRNPREGYSLLRGTKSLAYITPDGQGGWEVVCKFKPAPPKMYCEYKVGAETQAEELVETYLKESAK